MIKKIIKRVLRMPSYILLPLSSRYKFFAKFNYFFLSNAFNYENKFILIAKSQYIKNIKEVNFSNGKFRRNIHRIEKGLTLTPMKESFAHDYIINTTNTLEILTNKNAISLSEKSWAISVLTEYFKKVKHTGNISKAYIIFNKIDKNNVSISDLKNHYPIPSGDGDITWLNTLMKTRRSVRHFKSSPVSANLIYECMDIASYAPSACNRQPYRLHYTNDCKLAKEIAKCAGGTGGWVDNIFNVAVIIGDQSNYLNERDRHLIYIDSSLASMQFILQLEARGISSCVINWPDQVKAEHKIRNIIEIAAYERPIFLIALGYPTRSSLSPNSFKKQGLYNAKQ